MVFTSLDLLKWSLTASVLNRVLASLFHIFELLLAGVCLSFYIFHKAYPFPLYTSITKFQSFNILTVDDQRSTYAGISELRQIEIMNLVLFSIIIIAFKSFTYFLGNVFFLISFTFALNIKRCITYFFVNKFVTVTSKVQRDKKWWLRFPNWKHEHCLILLLFAVLL